MSACFIKEESSVLPPEDYTWNLQVVLPPEDSSWMKQAVVVSF